MLVAAILAAGPGVACGKRGAPLPPLVRLPAAPGGLTAERRGDTVRLRFTVPRVNTDESRPANVIRVEIFALSGPLDVTDEELLARGTRIASVAVKTPRNPDETIAPGEPDDDLPPLVGEGPDQGALVDVTDVLAPATAVPAVARTYISVGVTAKGRQGAPSARAAVPLAPAPPPPAAARAAYDEREITLAWQAPAAADTSSTAYHVYEVAPPAAPAPPGSSAASSPAAGSEVRLTDRPVTDTRYRDQRMTWGVTRCYVVRSVMSLGTLAVEGDGTAPVCVALADTFPPAAPTGLQAVSGEGAINLIWDANAELDLAGYLVLRATGQGGALMPVTGEPVDQTTFRDAVQAGVAYVYAVVAVDRAGNRSPASNRVEEAGR